MRTKIAAACLVATAGMACQVQAVGNVVIAEIYAGGGFAPSGVLPESTYRNDYVVLFNRSATPVSVNGWSLQYGSAAGTTWGNRINLPNVSIPAGKSYLVRLNIATGTCTTCVDVPAFDLSGGAPLGTIDASGTAGKLALVRSTTALTGGAPNLDPLQNINIEDYVGYGSTANSSEGSSPSPSFNSTVGPFSGVSVISRLNTGCQDTDVNSSDFAVIPVGTPRNSGSAFQSCAGGTDCNNNGIVDSVEIAGNPSLDCNNNTQLDSCELALNPAIDCNSNGQIDTCEIAANPGLDCNGNGKLDTCDIAADLDIDGGATGCGAANGVIDSCETPASGEDCNANGKKDCWDFKTFLLTDVNGNSIADVCEGAAVVETSVNGTVQAAGVRAAPNGDSGFNIEGTVAGGTSFASYGALRWNVADIAAALPPGYTVTKVYMFLQQWNAAFTAGGIPGLDPDNLEFFYTNNDAIAIAPGTATTTFGNFATDFADAQSVRTYMFQESSAPVADLPGAGTAVGSGAIDAVQLYDAAGTNTAGATAMASELASGTGQVTLLLNIANGQQATAATYAGRTHDLYRGPTLVVFASAGAACDTIDFNHDDLFPDTLDIDDFLSVFSGGGCSNDPNCGDIDFNNDGLFPDTLDIDALLSVFSGGPCLV